MDLSGSYAIPAPPEHVWRAMNDPAVLRVCIPACRTLERVSEEEFRAVFGTSIGPFELAIEGRILVSDVLAPWRYTLTAEGSGGLAGKARAVAQVSLRAESDGTTTLIYTAEGTAKGMILRKLADKLITGTAQRYVDAFFTRFAEQVTLSAAMRESDGAG
jgi:carbon monoxide dehydrogenase subunit G